MNITRMNKRVGIYRMIEGLDNDLYTTERVPELVKEIWAEIQPRTGSLMRGREAGTMLSKTTHAILMYSESASDIRDDYYIVWNDEFGNKHEFEIDYILPPAGAPQTMLYCTEVVRHGI